MQTHIQKFTQLSTQQLFQIYKLRVDVFVVEQQCPYHEVDDIDLESYHIYLQDDNNDILSYCRPYQQNDTYHIGRVISSERRKGYGTQIMKTVIQFAKKNLKANTIIIEAQTYAVEFYKKLGFVVISEPFDEDGIEHVRMKYNGR